jgi:O-antigen/teichoic acid export membrane protein
MTAIKSSSHLLGNSAWNAGGFLVGVGLNLFILPFVLFRLGAAAFGVAGLVTACIAPAMAFSNALALSTTRELAQRLAPGERDDARRFFATALLLAAAGGLLMAMPVHLCGVSCPFYSASGLCAAGFN